MCLLTGYISCLILIENFLIQCKIPNKQSFCSVLTAIFYIFDGFFSMKTKENVFTKYEVDFQLSGFFQRNWEVLFHNFVILWGFFFAVVVAFF